MLERLDRDQLTAPLPAAIERNHLLEQKAIEHAKRIEELEARLRQGSSNSSKPPSSGGYSKPAPKPREKKSGKKPGGNTNTKGMANPWRAWQPKQGQ
jgi:hypothetical protein